jgi:SAM-dependent methyltransferase
MTVLDDIRSEVLGSSVASLGAAGFLTCEGLDRIIRALSVGHPCHLLDVGCGRGQPGLFIATSLACHRYTGYDIDPACVAAARSAARASPFCAHVFTGDIARQRRDSPTSADTMPPAPADAGMAHDSLYLTPDLPAAVDGMARLLAPGARAWISAYVSATAANGHAPSAATLEGGVQGRTADDWRRVLDHAGLDVLACDDVSSEWRITARALHGHRLAAADRVRRDLDPAAGAQALWISRRMLGLDGRAAFLDTACRIEITACRRGPS